MQAHKNPLSNEELTKFLSNVRVRTKMGDAIPGQLYFSMPSFMSPALTNDGALPFHRVDLVQEIPPKLNDFIHKHLACELSAISLNKSGEVFLHQRQVMGTRCIGRLSLIEAQEVLNATFKAAGSREPFYVDQARALMMLHQQGLDDHLLIDPDSGKAILGLHENGLALVDMNHEGSRPEGASAQPIDSDLYAWQFPKGMSPALHAMRFVALSAEDRDACFSAIYPTDHADQKVRTEKGVSATTSGPDY